MGKQVGEQPDMRTRVALKRDNADLLDRIEAQREVVEAARLKRNTLIHDGDRLENGKSFSGEWVAVPREDFDRLREALDQLEEQTDD